MSMTKANYHAFKRWSHGTLDVVAHAVKEYNMIRSDQPDYSIAQSTAWHFKCVESNTLECKLDQKRR